MTEAQTRTQASVHEKNIKEREMHSFIS